MQNKGMKMQKRVMLTLDKLKWLAHRPITDKGALIQILTLLSKLKFPDLYVTPY